MQVKYRGITLIFLNTRLDPLSTSGHVYWLEDCNDDMTISPAQTRQILNNMLATGMVDDSRFDVVVACLRVKYVKVANVRYELIRGINSHLVSFDHFKILVFEGLGS